MSTALTAHEIGRVERVLARLYHRLGSRLVPAYIVAGSLLGVLAGAISMDFLARYIGLSVGEALVGFGIWMPITLGCALLGVRRHRGQLSTLRVWAEGRRTMEAAPDTWYAVIRLRRAVFSALAAGLVALPGMALYIVLEFHKPWYGVLGFSFGAAVGAVSVAILIAFSVELAVRPMLAEVAAYLPGGFEPGLDGLGLRARTVAAFPAVTLFAAVLVGAYSNESKDGTDRLTFALAASLVSVAVAAVIFLIINRAALAPIGDLIAATRRVRGGDITTPVPLVSADELGALAYRFNEMLAELRRHTEELRASRERLAAAADAERRRFERDLHEGAERRLVHLGMELEEFQRSLARGDDAAALAAEVHADLRRALGELRDLARGMYPPRLAESGLAAALGEAAQQAAIPARVRCQDLTRYPPQVESAVYFCCLEALQNAAKHAGPGASAAISVAAHDGVLRFTVADDGAGFDLLSATASAGLQNMTDRIGALGGELRIDSTPGSGASVSGSVPLRS